MEYYKILEGLVDPTKADEVIKNNKINKSFVLDVKIPGVKLYKSKGIDVIELQGVGVLYGKKYNTTSGLTIRFTSTDKSFKTLYSIDVFNNKHIQPIQSVMNVNNLDEEKIKQLVSDIFKNETKLLGEGLADLPMYISGALAIFSIGMVLYGIFVQQKRKHLERQVYSNSNLKKEEDFFKISSADENDFKVFSILTNIIDNIVKGNRNSLVINGKPGLGKSYLVKKRLVYLGKKEKTDYITIKGSTDLDAFYEMLYDYKDRLIIFDDCDNLMDDISFINIIKAVTDTMPRRVVSLKRKIAGANKAEIGEDKIPERIPNVFEFSGKVIIITNLPGSKIDSAIISRTGLYTIKVSPDEMMKRIESMVKNIRPDVPLADKEEVVEYLRSIYAEHPELNFDLRLFVYAIDDRSSGLPNWKELVKSRIIYSDDL